MKKLLLIGLCLTVYIQTTAQTGVAINNTGNPADVSAMLDVSSTDKGFLLPKMTQAQRDLITSPATGLMIFQIDGATPGVYVNGGTPTAPNWLNASGANAINDLSDGISDGTDTVFLGTGAGASNTTSGNGNTAVGINAFNGNTSGSDNTVVGFNANSNGSGNFNTVIGKDAFSTGGGSNVTAIGYKALELSTSSSNVAVGASSGELLVSGVNNTFVGYSSGSNQTVGTGNIVLGSFLDLADLSGSNQMNLGDVIHATSIGTAGARVGVGNSNAAPNSTLDVGGSLSLPITLTTRDLALSEEHYTVVIPSGVVGTPIITLPDPANIVGRIYVIKILSGSTITLISSGSATIDGIAGFWSLNPGSLIVQAGSATEWFIIGNYN